MSNLADPHAFFAARRKLPIVNSKYQPRPPVKKNAGLKAQGREASAVPQREDGQLATPMDQRSVFEATKDDSAPIPSPSSYATGDTRLSSVSPLIDLQAATSRCRLDEVPPLEPAPAVPDMPTANLSFSSTDTEVLTPGGRSIKDGSMMSLHSRLWAIEEKLGKRVEQLERHLKVLGRSDVDRPISPPPEKELDTSSMRTPQAGADHIYTHAGGSGQLFPDNNKHVQDGEALRRVLPSAIRALPALANLPLSQTILPMEKLIAFPQSFLLKTLGGTEFSPGIYYPAIGAKTHSKDLARSVNHKTYALLDSAVEPYAPKQPGQHGARLVVLMRPLASDKMVLDMPVFVSFETSATSGEDKYVYLGHYSQKHWSDRLDYDRIKELVPTHVKEHWAEILSAKDKPEWLHEELMKTLRSKPEYDGEIAGISFGGAGEGPDERQDDKLTKVNLQMREFMEDLSLWQEEASQAVNELTAEGVMEAFDRADADAEPGLRFWWEYLQCVGFDRNFYYILATELERRSK